MSDPKNNILIVEDNSTLGDYLVATLEAHGYEATLAASGKRAISMSAITQFDLILLDFGLPDIDGLRVLKSIRGWSDVPIIAVSARTEELATVEALDAGADDYITKPFGSLELLARIRAILRIYRKITQIAPQRESVFSAGRFSIDYDKRAVVKDGQLLHFTPIEYKILVLLSQKAGHILTRDEILHRVWGENQMGDGQILRVNIANIRRKLEDNPAAPTYILTEVGVGYRMAASE